jgi:hypothetical protein
MAKGTHLGWAKPDDPIYSGGPMISFHPPSPGSMQGTATDTDGGLQAETNGRQRKPGQPLTTSELDPMQPAVDQIEKALYAAVTGQATERFGPEPSAQSGATTRKPDENTKISRRRIVMGKVTDHGLAGPDDPIYKGGLRVSSVLGPSALLEDPDGADPMAPAALQKKLAETNSRTAPSRQPVSTTRKPRGNK